MSKRTASSSSNPLLSEEQDGDFARLEYLFQWFLGMLLLGVTAGIFVSLSNHNTMQAIITGVGYLPIAAAYILARRKKLETAVISLAALLITLMTVIATQGLGIHHISVIGYPAIIIVASLVARKRILIFLILYTLACLGWLVFGELLGLYTPTILERSVPGDFFSAAAIIIITALMTRSVSEALLHGNTRYRRELSNRRQVEHALALSEGKFSRAFHTSPVMMTIEGSDHKFIDVNQAFVDGLGYAREEALGVTAVDLKLWASEEDAQKVRALIARQEKIRNVEVRFRRKSGEVGVALMSSDRFEVNRESYGLTSALNISDRKWIEAEANRRAEEASLLNRLVVTLASGENLYETLRAFVRELKQIMTADAFHIGLYDADADLFTYSLFLNLNEDLQPPPRKLRESPGLTWEVLSNQKTIYLEDVTDPQVRREHNIVVVVDIPVRSYVGIPLTLQDRVIGVMSVQALRPAAYSPDQIRLLQTIAAQVAITIEKLGLLDQVQRELAERKRTESKLHQREAILDAVAVSAEAFFKARDWKSEVNDLLERLGKNLHSTHAYLFQNVKREDGALATTMMFEWTQPGFESDLDSSLYKGALLKEGDLASWYQTMHRGLPYVGDQKSLDRDDYHYLLDRGLKALLDVPIIIDGFWWGILGFDDMATERVWSDAEVDGLVAAANVLAGAIKRSQMDSALQKYASRLGLLHDIDRALLSAQSLGQIADEALSRIRQLIPSQRASITMFDFPANEARFLAANFETVNIAGAPVTTLQEFGQHIIDELQQNKSCFVGDSLTDSRSTNLDIDLAQRGLRSWVYFPLRSQGQLFGSLNLGRMEKTPFTDEEESIGYEIANQLAIALQQNKLLEALQNELNERKIIQDVLFEEKERAEVTLHSIGDAVITTDVNALVNYLNPVAENLTGWESKEAAGQPLENIFRVVNEDSRKPVLDPVARCLQEERVIELANHSILIRRDGQEFSIDDSAAPIRNRKGEVIGAVLVFHDITEERRLIRQVAHDAIHDSLTGLINRREFEKRLGRALTSARERNLSHVLCYFDLDQFKIVNDTAGHVAGDELLKRLATILGGLFRQRDTFARLGGDEFGLLLENCTLERAQVICANILEKTRDFSFMWGENNFHVSVSIGITQIAAEKESVDQILSQADIACYAAKDLGRNRINIYQSEDSETAQRHGEIIQAARMRDAVANDQFVLYCQPIAELSAPTLDFLSYEVLLRMQTGGGKLSLPSSFIPSAERYGLMPAIDRWVIRQTFHAMSKSGLRGVLVDINLSGNSLDDETLLDYVLEQLDEFSIPPKQVCFEITETAAIQHINKARQFTQAFRERGGKIALDDFGSGFSSFRYLKTLPVDYIKIDGEFVREMLTNPNDQAMVEAIAKVAHTLGIYVIAEHATNVETVNRLRDLGVEGAQGHGIGHPVPVEDAWK